MISFSNTASSTEMAYQTNKDSDSSRTVNLFKNDWFVFYSFLLLIGFLFSRIHCSY